MILFDLLAEATIGAAFAASERERIEASSTFGTPGPQAALRPEPSGVLGEPSFAAGLLFSTIFYVPAMVVFVTLWPGWSAHYAIDLDGPLARGLFAAADAIGLVACYGAGFALGARAIRRRSLAGLLRSLAVAWAAMALLLFVVLAVRSNVVATHAGFLARDPRAGVPSWGAPDALLGGWVMVALVMSVVWNGVPLALFYRAGRRRSGRT